MSAETTGHPAEQPAEQPADVGGPRRSRALPIVFAVIGLSCLLCGVAGALVAVYRRSIVRAMTPVHRQLTYEVTPFAGEAPAPDLVERTRAVLARRLEGLEVAGSAHVEGVDTVRVDLPEMDDEREEEVERLLRERGLLRFRIVVTSESPAHAMSEEEIEREIARVLAAKEDGTWDAATDRFDVGLEPDVGGRTRPLLLLSQGGMAGSHITRAHRKLDDAGRSAIAFTLDDAGREAFARITRENIRERLAIVLDDRVLTSPVIRSEIAGGEGIITTGYGGQAQDEREAETRRVVALLDGGALPGEIELVLETVIARPGGGGR